VSTALGWATIDQDRPLFSYSFWQLSTREKVLRSWVRFKIAVNERRSQAPPKASAFIAPRALPSAELSDLTCMMIIGSLGAGGAETQMVRLLEELQRQGSFKRLVVACLFLGTPAATFYRARLEAIGVEIIDMATFASQPLPTQMCPPIEEFPVWAKDRLAIYVGAIDAVQPDILHLWMDEVNVIGGLAALSLRTPAILLSGRSQAPYHFPFHQPWMKGGYKRILSASHTQFYANSKSGAADYARWIGLPRLEAPHIYNGFDLLRSSVRDLVSADHDAVLERLRQDRSGRSLKLMAVGRLSQEKQPFYLIDMMREILRLDPKAHLLWVGDGVETKRVDAELEKMPVGSITRVSRSENVLDLMQISDAVVLPSRIEGLPNVVMEAQALGIPVYTPSAGGAREAFIPGRTGLQLPARDSKAAGRMIFQSLKDGQVSIDAKQFAPKFVEEQFSNSGMANGTLCLYKALSSQKWRIYEKA
jgi:glycosyltransferase involved in cell wall biosynthesis